MTVNKWAIVLFLLFVSNIVWASESPAYQVRFLSGAAIKVPDAPGMVDVRRTYPSVFRMHSSITPPHRQLEVLYMNEEAAKAIADGYFPEDLAERSVHVQTVPEIRGVTVNAQEFRQYTEMLKSELEEMPDELLSEIKSQADGVLDDLTEAIADALSGGEIELHASLEGIQSLGLVSEGENFLKFGFLQSIGFEASSSPHEMPYAEDALIVNIASVIRVRERILFLHVYSDFFGQEDIRWAKDYMGWYLDQFLRLN